MRPNVGERNAHTHVLARTHTHDLRGTLVAASPLLGNLQLLSLRLVRKIEMCLAYRGLRV